jgi:hypothetical protein
MLSGDQINGRLYILCSWGILGIDLRIGHGSGDGESVETTAWNAVIESSDQCENHHLVHDQEGMP